MKVGRNDDCPCGSGKKHKRCCAAADDARRTAELAAATAAAAQQPVDAAPSDGKLAKSSPGSVGDWKRRPRANALALPRAKVGRDSH